MTKTALNPRPFGVFNISVSGSFASHEDLNLVQSAEKIIQVLFPTSALSLLFSSELNQTHHVFNIKPELFFDVKSSSRMLNSNSIVVM